MIRNLFKRKAREIPELNTSSLPDLIFTVLFFFMIVTNMREDNVKVRFREPAGTQLEKLENKSLGTTVYIGPSNAPSKDSQATCIQINDKIVGIDEVSRYISAEMAQMGETERENMVVTLKIDKATPMSIVEQVKAALKEANALKISYTGTKKKQ